jgi:hypothetical protein
MTGETNWNVAETLLSMITTRLRRPGERPADQGERGLRSWFLKFIRIFRAEAAADLDQELHALDLQINLVSLFISLRRLARQKLLPKPQWPADSRRPELMKVQPNFVVNNLLTLLRIIIDDPHLPAHAKDDMVTDYWNKWAFITWERAMVEEVPAEQTEWLGFVERYLRLINEDPRRATWTPGQMNLLRLQLAQLTTLLPATTLNASDATKPRTAQDTLHTILGFPPTPPIDPAPAPDVTKLADVIAKMSEVPDPISIGSILRRSFPGLTPDSIQQITEKLAGRMSPGLLDQIFRQYSNCV